MAHRTRRRLTKTELKRDPVAENLGKAWDFLRSHVKETAIVCVAVLALIIVAQSLISSSRKQDAESMAQYLLAETMFEQAEQMASAGNAEDAAAALNQAYALASDVYQRNQNRDWGCRAAILAAKAGIMLGREDEVIETLQAMLSSRPEKMTELSARLHLGVALENRGGLQDLAIARTNFTEILADSAEYPLIAAEALSGLSRLSFGEGDLEAAGSWLEQSIAMKQDTTDFDEYQLARLEWAR